MVGGMLCKRTSLPSSKHRAQCTPCPVHSASVQMQTFAICRPPTWPMDTCLGLSQIFIRVPTTIWLFTVICELWGEGTPPGLVLVQQRQVRLDMCTFEASLATTIWLLTVICELGMQQQPRGVVSQSRAVHCAVEAAHHHLVVHRDLRIGYPSGPATTHWACKSLGRAGSCSLCRNQAAPHMTNIAAPCPPACSQSGRCSCALTTADGC